MSHPRRQGMEGQSATTREASVQRSVRGRPSVRKRPSYLRAALQRRPAIAGLVLVGTTALIALFAPLISPYDPIRADNPPLLPPGTGDHYLGTTSLGRDVLAAVAHGGRVSLVVGLSVAIVATLIGIVIGALAGYVGGWVDDVLMRATEVFLIIPRFFLAILIVAMFGNSLLYIIIVLAILGWPPIARVVRAEFLSLREREFVVSARAIGAHPTRIIVLDILPNALAPAIVVGTLQVSSAILTEASLAYLGLGDPSVSSWGKMIVDSQNFLRTRPWLAFFPGVAITAAVVGFNLLGDGLARALNPRADEGR